MYPEHTLAQVFSHERERSVAEIADRTALPWLISYYPLATTDFPVCASKVFTVRARWMRSDLVVRRIFDLGPRDSSGDQRAAGIADRGTSLSGREKIVDDLSEFARPQ